MMTKTFREKLLIVIPAYNEEKSLPRVIEEITSDLPGVDIVVVDDGSTDSTLEVARRAGATGIRLPVNLGIGGAVQTGILFALRRGYEAAIQIDADGQHIPSEASVLIEAMEETHADVVCGSRYLAPLGDLSTPVRRLGIRFFSEALRFLAGARITDPTSGFRLFGPKAIALIASNYATDYPEVEAILFLKRRNLSLVEVPVQMRPRQAGQSSITPGRSLYYMCKVLLALVMERLRPKEAP